MGDEERVAPWPLFRRPAPVGGWKRPSPAAPPSQSVREECAAYAKPLDEELRALEGPHPVVEELATRIREVAAGSHPRDLPPGHFTYGAQFS